MTHPYPSGQHTHSHTYLSCQPLIRAAFSSFRKQSMILHVTTDSPHTWGLTACVFFPYSLKAQNIKVTIQQYEIGSEYGHAVRPAIRKSQPRVFKNAKCKGFVGFFLCVCWLNIFLWLSHFSKMQLQSWGLIYLLLHISIFKQHRGLCNFIKMQNLASYLMQSTSCPSLYPKQ